jgi:hypothetical protein
MELHMTLVHQMLGAARLNGTTYEDVEADPRSNWDAFVVVILTSVAAAVGSGVTTVLGVGAVTLAASLTWLVWALLTFVIGTTLLSVSETHATLGEMLRTTGFSAAPGILRVFGFLPVVGWPIFAISTVWMLLAFVVAVRHALDFTSSGRAFLVCFLGWLIHAVLFFGFVRSAI